MENEFVEWVNMGGSNSWVIFLLVVIVLELFIVCVGLDKLIRLVRAIAVKVNPEDSKSFPRSL